MADPAGILARVRARGANVALRDGKLSVLNAKRLPDGASEYIAQNRDALVAFLSDEEVEVDERAAIIEFDGKTPREWSRQFADILIRTRPAGISDLDWSWFITRCGHLIDEAPAPEGASW